MQGWTTLKGEWIGQPSLSLPNVTASSCHTSWWFHHEAVCPQGTGLQQAIASNEMLTAVEHFGFLMDSRCWPRLRAVIVT